MRGEEDRRGAPAPRDEGGFTAELPARVRLPLLVGATTTDQKNTYRPDLRPVACLRIDDVRFGYGSSFVAWGVRWEMRRLAALLEERPGLVASVFGHADPVGTDEFNKALSGRRAMVVYGALTRDTALWENVFSSPLAGDDWGLASIQLMLEATGYSPGALDGVGDEPTAAAVRRFQASKGLTVSGDPDAATRAALFEAYMGEICVDDSARPFKMEKAAFLGRGADPKGKADYQGCGEFNPTRVFSTKELQRLEVEVARGSAQQHLENATNRRVVVYLFPPGTHIEPSHWPCPRADEGIADCTKRFWSDAGTRRQTRAERRDFETGEDTFACRFYERLAVGSPCERVRPSPPWPPLIAGRLPSLCSVGKTFPKPSSIPMLRDVARISGEDRGARVLVVGHTDRTGADSMNLALSRARAASVRAFLLRDAAFFRARFDAPDPLSAWDWEEIQWMLSAVEIDGDPCYAGFVDGHCSDMTLAALQSFQLSVGLEANHLCGDRTLSKLIEKYLETLGPVRPTPEQIEILGGGSWHPPRTFGENSAPAQDLLSSSDDLPGFRRVEVFIGREPFRPPARACAAARHATCAPYEAWCKAVEDELHAAQRFTMAIRVVDLVGEPVANCGVDLFEAGPESDDVLIASLTATAHGLIRLTAPPGHYALRVAIGGGERVGFYVYPDEVGGMTVRLRDSLARLALAGAVSGG